MEKFYNIDYTHVKKLQKSDIESFNILYKKYSPRLYRFSLNYLKSPEEAEDIVQEVFCCIWEKRKGLNPEYSFNSYLFTIAFNIIKKHFIRLAQKNKFKDEWIYSLLKQNDDLDTVLDYKFLLKEVEAIVNSLPNRRRLIFIKRKFVGLPIKQIAEELGISPNTVENQLTIAQKTIREELFKKKLSGLLFHILFISMI